MENVMYLGFRGYNSTEPCVKFHTKGEITAFIGREASRLNYGLYRTWVIDDVMYFDCGPIVYRFREEKFAG